MDTQNTRTLYVELLPLDTTEDEVKRLFSVFGKVRYIDMPTFYPEHPLNKGHSTARSKGYTFVEYYTREDAQKACDFFNDLKHILTDSNDQTCDPSNNEVSEKRPMAINEKFKLKLLDNPRYVSLAPLRVMLKSNYLDLARQYKEQKFQSLMRVAKSLAII